MEEEFYCSNCNRKIPATNRIIHEIRCVPIKSGESRKAISEQGRNFDKVEKDLPIARPVVDVPRVGPPSAPSISAKSGWTCSRCTYFNENVNSHECEVCGTSCLNYLDGVEKEQHIDTEMVPDEYIYDDNEMMVPTAPSTSSSSTSFSRNAIPNSNIPPNSWQCTRCTLINSLNTDECSACGETRPIRETRRERLIGEDEEGPFSPPSPYVYVGSSRPFIQEEFMPPRPRRSNVPSSALFGATIGAGLAFMNNRSMTRGAIEGASMGMLGGLMMDMLSEETESRMTAPQPVVIHRGFGPAGPIDIEMIAAQLFAAGGGIAQTQGVSEEALNQLPTHVYKTSDSRNSNRSTEHTSCSICLSAFEDGDNVRTLPCLHRFHVQCVDRWFERSNACPICKHTIH